MCRPARETPGRPRYPEGMFSGRGEREPVRTRVLVAFGEEHHAYREVIAVGIRILRPGTEVATATPAEIEEEIGRFGPQVVVCGVPGISDPGDRPAWVELPAEPNRPAKIRVGAHRRESTNLALSGLLEIIAGAEELVRARAGRAGGQGPSGFIHLST